MIQEKAKILLINAGSSSLKFKVYDSLNLECLIDGICDSIGLQNSCIKVKDNNEYKIIKYGIDNFNVGIESIIDLINKKININEIVAIGHRIVHGGDIKENQIITDELVDEIKKFSQFAPLHNPVQLEVYNIIKNYFRKAKHFAFFDTVFHSTIPEINHRYAICDEWYEKDKIRKYGFHGNSYAYVLEKMKKILNKEKLNLIILHLGNGSSICTIKDSLSFDTTMGFSPLDGLVMGTRSGNISSSIIKYFYDVKCMSIDGIFNVLNKKSGLLGLCNSSDVRTILNNLDNDNVKLGLDIFVDRIVREIVVSINQLENNIDAIVFCGGIGENAKYIQQLIINKINICKLKLNNDYELINYDYKLISSNDSVIKVFAVRTNEEYYMANQIVNLMK